MGKCDGYCRGDELREQHAQAVPRKKPATSVSAREPAITFCRLPSSSIARSRSRIGAKMDLIKLANQNAREEVERATTHEERRNKLLEALGKMLSLEAPPKRMESYDISNQGASDIVASMVV